jgi:GT2 family glycosyltransferase
MDIKSVDVILHTTFFRDEMLEETLCALNAYRSRGLIDVFIGDTRPIEKIKLREHYNNFNWFDFGFDTTLAKTKNCMIAYGNGDYILHFDDDFIISEKIKLDEVIDFMEKNNADIVGIKVVSKKVVSPFIYEAKIYPDKIDFVEPTSEWIDHNGMKFRKVDIVPNCWIAKRKAFTEKGLWFDERYSFGDGLHPDFFLEAKKLGLNVFYTPDSEVYHLKHDIEMPDYYKKKRFRHFPNHDKLLKKWKIKSINIW